MISNLQRYEDDFKALLEEGEKLWFAALKEFSPQSLHKSLKSLYKDEKKVEQFLKVIPSFTNTYQSWYSQSIVLINQLLPDRLQDFVRLYQRPKLRRKTITCDNYVIEDALLGLNVTRGWEKEKIVGPDAVLGLFQQQLSILKSIKNRFESSLFDIRQLVQADLFSSELDKANELNKKGFVRAAGAVAGVVLESHLLNVCSNHNVSTKKKYPGINDLAQLLYDSKVIEIPILRKIQHLADLRNLCDHKKTREPKSEEIEELIEGVQKITKTIY